MLRESLQRWVAASVTGEITLRLRRGDDYTIVSTKGPAFSYHPAFGPDDRIGLLTMRNLDIADSRSRLEQYASLELLGDGATRLVGEPEPSGAEAISANPDAGLSAPSDDEEALGDAAMEFGAD